jgi:hypothetical protein
MNDLPFGDQTGFDDADRGLIDWDCTGLLDDPDPGFAIVTP